jgi:hypothetical protein
MVNVLSQLLEYQQYCYLRNVPIDNLAHKLLHTFEKIDAINPTSEPINQLNLSKIKDVASSYIRYI